MSGVTGAVSVAHEAGKAAWDALAWLTDDDAWASVDAALWARCAGYMTPAERDRMNREIRQNLRSHGANLAAQAVEGT